MPVDTHILLVQIAAVLLAARLFAEVALRLRAPPIIGEICAGIIALTTLLPPFVMKWYYGRYGDRLQETAHG